MPVMSATRDGTQTVDALYAFSKITPLRAMRSRLGVWKWPPLA